MRLPFAPVAVVFGHHSVNSLADGGRATEVCDRGSRRCDLRLLRGERCHLSAHQQGSRQDQFALLGGVNRRLCLQRQHDQSG